jgi:hypothetical protein
MWMVNFTPRPLYAREGARGTHCIRGWVGSTADLDDEDKTLPYRDLNFAPFPPQSSRPQRCFSIIFSIVELN